MESLAQALLISTQKIGLIRVTYDPPVCTRVNICLFFYLSFHSFLSLFFSVSDLIVKSLTLKRLLILFSYFDQNVLTAVQKFVFLFCFQENPTKDCKPAICNSANMVVNFWNRKLPKAKHRKRNLIPAQVGFFYSGKRWTKYQISEIL